MISMMRSKMVTMTAVMALTHLMMAMKTLAMAEMMEFRPAPIAENTDPIVVVVGGECVLGWVVGWFGDCCSPSRRTGLIRAR
ncbi:hypothetical protein GGG16DRAFT_88168 [Schizophyllum commune]